MPKRITIFYKLAKLNRGLSPIVPEKVPCWATFFASRLKSKAKTHLQLSASLLTYPDNKIRFHWQLAGKYIFGILAIFACFQSSTFADEQGRPNLYNSDYAVNAWLIPDKVKTREAALKDKLKKLDKKYYCDVSNSKLWNDIYKAMGVQLQNCNAVVSEGNSDQHALSQTNWGPIAINGLTDFIVDRAKGETRLWVTQQTLKELCDPSNQEYFPITCLFYRQYQLGIPVNDTMLVKNFRSDLTSLPAYIIWKNENNAEWGYILTNLYLSLRASPQNDQVPFQLIAGLGQNNLLRKAAQDNGCLATSPNCSLYWAGVITQAYLWAEKAPVDENNKNNKTSQFLAGLLIALADTDNKTAINSIADTYDSIEKASNKIEESSRAIQDISTQIKAEYERLNKAQQGDTQNQLTAKFRIIELSAHTVSATLQLKLGINPGGVSNTKAIQASMRKAESVAKVAGYMSTGNYSDAFNEFAPIASCLAGKMKATDELCQGWHNITCDSQNEATKIECDKKKSSIHAVARNLPIIVGLADAKTSDDIKNMLDSAASPIGAWRFKQEREMRSITALVGGHLSGEALIASSSQGPKPYAGFSTGIFAPVGVDITWPIKLESKNLESRNLESTKYEGFLISVIDLGNPVSARLTGNNTSQVTDTTNNAQLKDILSFGVFYHQSFENSPFVWGAGIRYSPSHRKATVAGIQSDVNSLQIGGFVAIDITMFPF